MEKLWNKLEKIVNLIKDEVLEVGHPREYVEECEDLDTIENSFMKIFVIFCNLYPAETAYYYWINILWE